MERRELLKGLVMGAPLVAGAFVAHYVEGAARPAHAITHHESGRTRWKCIFDGDGESYFWGELPKGASISTHWQSNPNRDELWEVYRTEPEQFTAHARFVRQRCYA